MAERLGEVTITTGEIALVDTGYLGDLELVLARLAVLVRDVPNGVAPIFGVRLGKGRFAKCWDHVYVDLQAAEAASSEEVGTALVDNARLCFADPAALAHWQHEEPIDGKADFVFWGKDAHELAKLVGAEHGPDGWGFRDLPIEEARARGLAAEKAKRENKLLLATDFRPHSHHWQILAQQRATETQSGTIEVGGARVTSFHTTWGDGVFPAYVDKDRAGRAVRVRVQLATDPSLAAMERVNG
jgi:hypothetical protein